MAAADESQKKLLLCIPNLPHANATIGADANANPVVRIWGEKPVFSYQPRDHVDLGASLGLFDLERAAKISGSGFVCFTNLGARLQRGLIQFLLDLHTIEHGYVEIGPPHLVRRECMVGTGQLPKFEEDAYELEEGQTFLIPTAEVPLTNLHREETLPTESCRNISWLTRPAFGVRRDLRVETPGVSFEFTSLIKSNWSRLLLRRIFL